MIRHDWKIHPNHATSDQAERALLGVLILDPPLLSACGALRPADFRSSSRGALFGMVALLWEDQRALSAVSLCHAMEEADIQPPAGLPGWATAIATLEDIGCHGCLEEGEARQLAEIIQEAALRRRLNGWAA